MTARAARLPVARRLAARTAVARRLAALVAFGALAACTAEGPTDAGRIGLVALEALRGDTGPAAPAPTRAALEALAHAVLAVSRGDGSPAYVAPLADNDGFVTWADAAGRALVIRGGLVVRTHGFGHDLVATRTARGDPVAEPRPLTDWPGETVREHQFRVRDGAGFSVVLRCVPVRGDRMRIEILGRSHAVVLVEERCASERRRVVNRHWVEPETGLIWRSEQWIGPQEAPVTLEVVIPYAPARRW